MKFVSVLTPFYLLDFKHENYLHIYDFCDYIWTLISSLVLLLSLEANEYGQKYFKNYSCLKSDPVLSVPVCAYSKLVVQICQSNCITY